jgi:hypothetical protein
MPSYGSDILRPVNDHSQEDFRMVCKAKPQGPRIMDAQVFRFYDRSTAKAGEHPMRQHSLNRRKLLATGGAMIFAPSAAHTAEEPFALYQARTIVTGQREETRIPGLKLCLRNVLVRVSGDPRIADNPALGKLIETPEAAMTGYTYRDLYAQRPIRDEQGTRDRPYEMTVDYDPAMIDSILAALGSRPWTAPRPTLMIFLAVKHIGMSYILSADIPEGSFQRESFAIASYTFAMPIIIPSLRKLDPAALTFETLPKTPLSDLQRLAVEWGADKALAGTLTWNREMLGWIAEWRMLHDGTEQGWAIGGVNFDAAFRNALGGAAQILSGNGTPT